MMKTSGEFKTKKKFIEFVGAKSNLNFISSEALIEGKYLSGLGLDSHTFKLTLYPDDTVDFDDVEGQQTTSEFRSNLLEVIFEKTITQFRKRMVITELEFTSINEINGKKIALYLAVEFDKPINKLASILDDVDVDVTGQQLDKLDDLLSLFDDERVTVEVEVDESNITEDELTQQKTETSFNSNLQNTFQKLKIEKIEELSKNLELKESEFEKLKREKNIVEKKIEDVESEIRLLNSRLDSLRPNLEPNGIYFNISERLNEEIILDEQTYDIIKSKVSKIKSINAEAFMNLFKEGEFKVRFSKLIDNNLTELVQSSEFEENILNSLSKLQLKRREDGFYLNSELTWAELVNSFIKLGFEQNTDWDKTCKSNSYSVTESEN